MATVKNANPGATISVFGFLKKDDDDSPPPARAASPISPQKGLAKAPKGVPTISNWEKNSDGSVTGFIKGSFSFGEGDAVTTSPIRGRVEGGTVVETASGSRYFLQPMDVASASNGRTVAKPAKAAKPTPPKKAPRGVPSLVNWKKNRDGSVTGFITGSDNFEEGERITTSPIASGDIGSGEVVQTGSGSKYFLV
jgi:hypothetical protein